MDCSEWMTTPIDNEQAGQTAYVMGQSGECVTRRELEDAANQGAHLFRRLGLKRGDHIALLLDNHPTFLKICAAAQRSGLYYSTINWRLPAQDLQYVVENCRARAFITSLQHQALVEPLWNKMPNVIAKFLVDGTMGDYADWDATIAGMPNDEIADPSVGAPLLYSSGTTGFPAVIKNPLPGNADAPGERLSLLETLYGATPESVFLSPAPLYHTDTLMFVMNCIRSGIEAVVMEQFDAELALQCIARYRVTHSQWAPMMLIRMLKLPQKIRDQHDISSLTCAVHAGEPCPMAVKEAVIDWWGPIVHEYYAGSESDGFVQLNAKEWLGHKGSVGRPFNCEVHICDDDGLELSMGEPGTVYFAASEAFEHDNDPARMQDSRHPLGWTTLGDIGYLDEDGYLYLTDRKHFMITSGGITIFPQEAESVLINHDKVLDVAIFGVPSEELGEEVKGVVLLIDPEQASPLLERQLMDYCRERLSHIKCPRSIDFRAQLPRHPTGKLMKRLLIDEYRQSI